MLNNPKVVIVIPARLESTRLPRKMLIKIGDLSLIQHTYLNALKAKIASRVIVATDSPLIQQEIKAINGDAILTSPECKTGTDRIAETIEKLEENYDIVINVQGDEPQMHPDTIDKVGQMLIDNPEAAMSTAKTKITQQDARDINKVKVVCDKFDNALYFSRSPIPYPRNLEATQWYKHLGIYAYRREFLKTFINLPQTPLEISESLEQLRALENGYNIKVLETPHDSLGVDMKEDLLKIIQAM